MESVVDNGDGTNTVTFLLTIENFGNVTLNNLKIFDDIVTQFASVTPTNFDVLDGSLFTNPSWDGVGTTNILYADQTLDVGATGNVYISFDVTPGTTLSIDNIATAEGLSPDATNTTDTSTDGLDPDPNSDDDPTNNSVPTPVDFLSPDLAITKDDGSTTYTPPTSVIYTVTVTNIGVSNVVGAIVSDVTPAGTTMSWTAVVNNNASITNASGSGDINELVDITAGAGNSVVYTVTVVVPDTYTGDLVNTATVSTPTGVIDTNTSNNSATDTNNPNEVPQVPVSDWAIYYGILLIGAFVIIRYRKRRFV